MSLKPGTNKQVPDHSIMDKYNKQTYLGNSFVFASGSVTNGGTTEVPLFLLSNPAISASSFPSGYTSLFVSNRSVLCLTASQTGIVRAYLNPTVTSNGTAKTPLNRRPANTNAAIGKLYQSPSVSANGSEVDFIASIPGQQQSSELLLILDPGQALLLTLQVSSGATAADVRLGWEEI